MSRSASAPPVLTAPWLAVSRPRLMARLDRSGPTRILLLSGAAGSGKTTLAAQVAALSDETLWLRADDGVASVLEQLRLWFDRAPVGTSTGTGTGTDGVVSGGAARATRTAVIDDAQLLRESAYLDEFASLLAGTPEGYRTIVAARGGIDLPSARTEFSGTLRLIDDDLRFRPFEAAELIRSIDPSLGVDDHRLLHSILAATGGWASGLELVATALAARDDSASRRAVLPRDAAAAVGDYVEHLLRPLDPDLRRRLAAAAAALDAGALSAHDRAALSAAGLLELTAFDRPQRLPEPIRRSLLLSSGGSEIATVRAAASVLEHEGRIDEALDVLASHGDPSALRALVERHPGRTATSVSTRWLDALDAPPPNAWGDILEARRALSHGRFELAAQHAAAAIRTADDPACLPAALQIAATASVWTAGPARPEHPARSAHPAPHAHSAHPQHPLQKATAVMLRGDLVHGLRLLRRGATSDDILGVALPSQLASVVLGHTPSATARIDTLERLDRIAREADRLGSVFIATIARCASAAVGYATNPVSARRTVDAIVEEFDDIGDHRTATLGDCAAVLIRMREGVARRSEFDALIGRFRRSGHASAEAWARSGAALIATLEQHPDALAEATAAETLARAAEAHGARAVALAALAAHFPMRSAELLASSAALARDAGLIARPWTWTTTGAPSGRSIEASGEASPGATRRSGAAPDASPRTPHRVLEPVREPAPEPVAAPHAAPAAASEVSIVCFGGFRVSVRSETIPLTRLRPRARTLLRLLAVHGGDPVHRELLAGVFWPDAGPSAALHSLHVALSSLRSALDAVEPGLADRLIVRDGEAYSLRAQGGVHSDLRHFDLALAAASAARSTRDHRGEAQHLRSALEVYRGDLLPEDGPAEWVSGARDRYRSRAAEAAVLLAHLDARRSELTDAIATARLALDLDPWRDDAWRLLIDLNRRAGEFAAATRAERDYARLLHELDVPG